MQNANAKQLNKALKQSQKKIADLVKSLGAKQISTLDKNSIRNHARSVLARKAVPKRCELCGFTEAVEVHHLIPISAFPKQAALSLVNSEYNLVYLCPNHHALVHKGAFSIDDIRLHVPRLQW